MSDAKLLFNNGCPTLPTMDADYFDRCAKMVTEAKAERERDPFFRLLHPKPLHELRFGNLYEGKAR